MKRILIFSLAALASLFIASCTPEEEEAIGYRITRTDFTFDTEGGQDYFHVAFDSAASEPQVTSDQSWCKATFNAPKSTNKTYRYEVTVARNEQTEPRTATITVTVGSKSDAIAVSQSALEFMRVSSDKSVVIPEEGGKTTIEVESNGTWEWACQSEWLTLESQSASSLTFSAPKNSGPKRSATVTLSLGTIVEEVAIAQEATSEVATMRTAVEIAREMYTGINIGNTLEACDNVGKTASETMWGNPKVNPEYIKGLKELGFNTIRIPCAWDYHIIDKTNHTIDPAWLERVSEVVGYILSEDMYAILNIHWDGGWFEENVGGTYSTEREEKLAAIWRQIAEKLGAYNDHLLFAGANEPYQQSQSSINQATADNLLRYMQAFVDAVRSTGGNNTYRTLVVQGPATNIDMSVRYMPNLPTDSVEGRLMFECHYYDPWQLTGMSEDASWGSMWYYWGEENFDSNNSHRNANHSVEDVRNQMQKLKNTYVDKGYPCIIGEYNVGLRTKGQYSDLNEELHKASRALWNEVVTREAKNAGCIPCYWETGGDVRRTDGAARNPYAIEGIMRGAAAGKYPF